MNQLTTVENKQLDKVKEYFARTDIIPFLVENTGLSEKEVSKRALEFMIKISNQDAEECDTKKHLSKCDPLSKQQAFLSIISLNLPSDIRALYYLYNSNGRMKLEVSYKGLIYIAEKYGYKINAGLVFEGDTFSTSQTSNGDTYELIKGDPFAKKKIVGCYVYVEGNNEKPRIYTYNMEELEKSRQKSKAAGSPAWKDFANDMYLKCGLRKALNLVLAKTQIGVDFEQALSDDEPLPVFSDKTSEFASQQFDEDEADLAEVEFKKQRFEELRQQFDYREQDNV